MRIRTTEQNVSVLCPDDVEITLPTIVVRRRGKRKFSECLIHNSRESKDIIKN